MNKTEHTVLNQQNILVSSPSLTSFNKLFSDAKRQSMCVISKENHFIIYFLVMNRSLCLPLPISIAAKITSLNLLFHFLLNFWLHLLLHFGP